MYRYFVNIGNNGYLLIFASCIYPITPKINSWFRPLELDNAICHLQESSSMLQKKAVCRRLKNNQIGVVKSIRRHTLWISIKLIICLHIIAEINCHVFCQMLIFTRSSTKLNKIDVNLIIIILIIRMRVISCSTSE